MFASFQGQIILDKTGIASFFDEIIDGNKVKLSKPDPEVFLKGAEGIGVLPSETVVFEDAVSGVQAAKKSGFYCVGIGNVDELNQADHVIDGLHDINLTKLEALFSKND